MISRTRRNDIRNKVSSLKLWKAHLRNEAKSKRLADARHSAAKIAVQEARRKLIEAIPDGAGQEYAEMVEWERLTWGVAHGWSHHFTAGTIWDSAHELVELVRILGEPVDLGEGNGGVLYAEPGDTFQHVRARYIEAGGTGL